MDAKADGNSYRAEVMDLSDIQPPMPITQSEDVETPGSIDKPVYMLTY